MAIQEIQENDYIKDSREVINSNFTELNTLKAPLASPAFTGTPTAPTPSPGDDSAKLATTEYVQEEIRTHANLPVGFEYFSPNPNIPQGSLPLIGGVYSRETYADLWDWVQTQTGYLITDSAWVTLSNTQNGNVPFYSSGDGSTTFRVPSLKCWIKGTDGVETVGTYKDAGLPNITGTTNYLSWSSDDVSGVFQSTSRNVDRTANSGSNFGALHTIFDASRSSSIYGNSNTVQPESIVGMWLVKAYGTIVDTGTIDEQAYIDDRIAAEVTRADGKYLPLAGGTMTGAIKGNPVTLTADDGNGNSADLVLNADGSATLDGSNIITSALTGNVLSAYGTSTAVNTEGNLCSISTHDAGVWLIIGFVDLNYDGSTNFYTNKVATASHGARDVRTTPVAGGGSINIVLESLSENELVSLKGWQAQSGTMRGTLQMVRLA